VHANRLLLLAPPSQCCEHLDPACRLAPLCHISRQIFEIQYLETRIWAGRGYIHSPRKAVFFWSQKAACHQPVHFLAEDIPRRRRQELLSHPDHALTLQCWPAAQQEHRFVMIWCAILGEPLHQCPIQTNSAIYPESGSAASAARSGAFCQICTICTANHGADPRSITP